MKRLFVLAVIVASSAILISACATQHKCPAYGHYTQVVTPATENVA